MSETFKPATINFQQSLALVGWCALCLATASTGFFVSTDGWYMALQNPRGILPPGSLAPFGQCFI